MKIAVDVPECIVSQIEELTDLCNRYPRKVPLNEVARLLGIDRGSLEAIELERLFGQSMTAYIQAQIRHTIEEALLADDRIIQVDEFSFERTGRECLTVTFTVHTTQGDFSAGFNYESEVTV